MRSLFLSSFFYPFILFSRIASSSPAAKASKHEIDDLSNFA